MLEFDGFILLSSTSQWENILIIEAIFNLGWMWKVIILHLKEHSLQFSFLCWEVVHFMMHIFLRELRVEDSVHG